MNDLGLQVFMETCAWNLWGLVLMLASLLPVLHVSEISLVCQSYPIQTSDSGMHCIKPTCMTYICKVP